MLALLFATAVASSAPCVDKPTCGRLIHSLNALAPPQPPALFAAAMNYADELLQGTTTDDWQAGEKESTTTESTDTEEEKRGTTIPDYCPTNGAFEFTPVFQTAMTLNTTQTIEVTQECGEEG